MNGMDTVLEQRPAGLLVHEAGAGGETHAMRAPSRLLVIIPAYNECRTIGETVRRLRALAPELEKRGVGLTIYLVDDGSSDGTAAFAIEAGVDRVIRHHVNRGLGAAVRTGLRAGRDEGFDILVKIDADLQHEPTDILDLIGPILADDADVVYGNRFERLEYRMPLVRRIGNVVFSKLMALLTGWPLRDSQPGIFAINKRYLAEFFLPGDYNYTQQVLLDAYHKGMRFAHVPVTFRARRAGTSFVSLAYPFKVIPQIILVIASVKPMRIFVPIGAAFLLMGSLVFGVQIVNWFLGNSTKPVENVNLVLGSVLFGLQTAFFGILAQLIVQTRR